MERFLLESDTAFDHASSHNHFFPYHLESPDRISSHNSQLDSTFDKSLGEAMQGQRDSSYPRRGGGNGRSTQQVLPSGDDLDGRSSQHRASEAQKNDRRSILRSSFIEPVQRTHPASRTSASQQAAPCHSSGSFNGNIRPDLSTRQPNGMDNNQQTSQQSQQYRHLQNSNNARAYGYEHPKPSSFPASSGTANSNASSNTSSGRLSAFKSSIARRDYRHWAFEQELTVKITGMKKGSWTSDVHAALFEEGDIVRIQMMPGVRDCSAIVTFQPPPNSMDWMRTLYVENTKVVVQVLYPRVRTVRSPTNPSRKHYEQIIFYADSMDFGVSLGETTMMKMHTVAAPQKIQVALNLKKKMMSINFPIKIDDEACKYRFELPIPLLHHIHKLNDESKRQGSLVIPFNSSPRVFKCIQNKRALSDTFNADDKYWYEYYAFYRQTDIVDGKTKMRMISGPVMNMKDAPIIDIGRWTTYRLSFDASTLTGSKFDQFLNALADHGISISDQTEYTMQGKNPAPLWNILLAEISSTHPHLDPSSPQSACDELFTDQVHLSFPVRYQLEACLSHGYLKEHTITREFLERLSSTDTNKAVSILEKVMDKTKIHYDPMDIFHIRFKTGLTKKVPSHCILAHAVNITPTMMHVALPTAEISNRIIRKFSADADRFIRVKFTDEKTENRLSYQGKRSDAPFDRVSRAMEHGIVVAGRYYEFLAFGNSQFRENAAYFYAPTESKSADDIRRSLGSFDHIRTVAKYGARIGQCFSTTRLIRNIQIMVVKISDIVRNGYTFSDGVGKLSLLLAQMAALELGIQNAFEDPPSLYQFRLAGCKGVLALDPSLLGNVAHIRPSQYKFEAKNEGLEIIRASAFATAYFNRQLIIVLSTLGVPDYMFVRKQQDMVNYLERATKEEDVALDKLRRNVDVNQISLTMAGMILDGFMKNREPFMMSMLQLWRAYNIKYLKEKARIFIEQGAFLLGCVDETASLRGHHDDPQCRIDATREEKLATLPEIFLQVSDPDKPAFYKVIEGICILARNPSLHPGDIRIVRAVNVSALNHLKNVVVLPQTGDRDLGNMCSGGDLDGDDYLIMWDTDFVPDTINEIPMDFTPPKPQNSDGPIVVSDIAKFFVTYMKNDSLGKIAHAHLAQADYNEEGVRDQKCLELAELHSQAVDYPKSGVPAVMNPELKPRKWPHFMEKKHLSENQQYKSTKVLGMLYDQVTLVDFKPQYENEFDDRILTAFDLDEDILQKAARIKANYDASLRSLMAKHSIRTEFEAWSVFVLSHNQETRDYKFGEEFGRIIDAIKHQFINTCCEAAGSNRIDFVNMAPFIAAMYTVTAHEMQGAMKMCRSTTIVGGQQVPVREMDPANMPLMSFPWLFTNELGRIATGSSIDRTPVSAEQGASRKAKHADLVTEFDEPCIGNIVTKDGVAHYGDLLKLEFEDPDAEEVSDPIEDAVAADYKPTHEPEARKGPPPPKGLSTTMPNLYELGAAVQDSGSERTRSPSVARSDSETTAFEEVKINHQTTKASALDRLMNLE